MALNKPGALGTVIAVIARTSELPCLFVRQQPYFILSVGSASDLFLYKGKNEWVPDEEYMDLGEWDEEVRFDIYDEPEFQFIKFCVFVSHADQIVRVGETEIDLIKVQQHAEHDAWWSLTNNGEYAGKVFIELTFYPVRKRRQSKAIPQTRPISQPPVQHSIRQKQPMELQQPKQPQQVQPPYSSTHVLPKAKPTPMPTLPQLPHTPRRWSGSAAQQPTFSKTPPIPPPLQYHQYIGDDAAMSMSPNRIEMQMVGAYPQSPVSPTTVDDNSYHDEDRAPGHARDVNYYTLLRDKKPHRNASSSSLPENPQPFGDQRFADSSGDVPPPHRDLADEFAGISIAPQARRVRRKPVGSAAAVTTLASRPKFFSASDIPLPPALQQHIPQRKKEHLPPTAHAPELGTAEGYAAVRDSDRFYREQLERQAEEEARSRVKRERELARRVLAPGSPALPPKIPLNVSREEFLAFQTRSRVV
ncbi:uncharacterized protein V1513DRAFT_437174 [Lipomyces chichibuensis]|uniref:uncharacterized protein n=1 Tax=Lipomyces chichibuensis TaxID=1546026 RepID=UPI0033436FB8